MPLIDLSVRKSNPGGGTNSTGCGSSLIQSIKAVKDSDTSSGPSVPVDGYRYACYKYIVFLAACYIAYIHIYTYTYTYITGFI